MSEDNLSLSEFDYSMAAVADYTMDTNITREMLFNIIQDVEDGYELFAAIGAQGNLMKIVENHNIMRNYHMQKHHD